MKADTLNEIYTIIIYYIIYFIIYYSRGEGGIKNS